MELFYLFNTINNITTKTPQNKNKLLLLIDPWHKETSQLTYGIQTFNWNLDEDTKVMSYKKIPHVIVDNKMASIHSNILSGGQMLLNIQNSDIHNSNTAIATSYSEIIQEIRNSVDVEMKSLMESGANSMSSVNNNNLYNIKKQLMLTDRFLVVVERYLDNEEFDERIVSEIDYTLADLVFYFEREDVMRIVSEEFSDNQVIDAMANLLDLQIKITEKINKINL